MASLFDPLQLGALTLPNRCIMAPMTRPRVGRDGVPTQTTFDYFTARVTAGLIITGGNRVSALAAGLGGETGLYDSAQIAAWRKVVDAIHQKGGRIFCQLLYGGAMSHPVLLPNESQPVGPSAINVGGRVRTHLGSLERVGARALEQDEIRQIIEDFRRAAAVAIDIGFDGVEVHACSGYLLEEFLCSGSNHRTDQYGGSAQNRSRLVIEVLEAVTSAAGSDRTGIKISPEYNRNRGNVVIDERPGETYTYLVREIEKRRPIYLQVADNSVSFEYHDLLRPLFSGVYFAGTGFDRVRAIDLLERNGADAIVFGKSYIANPDLFERLKSAIPFDPYDPEAPDVITPRQVHAHNRVAGQD